MTQYEYQVIPTHQGMMIEPDEDFMSYHERVQQKLNTLGRDGWQLVTSIAAGNLIVLMREIDPSEAAS